MKDQNCDTNALKIVKLMALNQIRVAIIGSGAISAALSQCLPTNFNLIIYGIREIKLTDPECETHNAIKQAHLVVYLGYHHRNIFVNLITLYKILSYLYLAKWKGLFIFFNTQAALDENCYKDLLPIPRIFKWDIYRLTKRIQSRILKIFDTDISISEIYLPVVVGRGSKAELRFEKIALHKDIKMPNFGASKIALLDLPNFSSWFWISSKNHLLNNKSDLTRKVFVFDDIKSTSQLISKYRRKHNLPQIEIKQYKASYWFSDNFLRNLIWMIKKSLIGLLLYIIFGLFKKSESLVPIERNSSSQAKYKFNYGTFVPDDIEYIASAREILLEKINFSILNISNVR